MVASLKSDLIVSSFIEDRKVVYLLIFIYRNLGFKPKKLIFFNNLYLKFTLFIMEQLAINLARLPLETVQSIRYELATSPKTNYDTVIAYLKDSFDPTCGVRCRFNKFFIIDGHIFQYPTLTRMSHKSCQDCIHPVEDYSFTYCYKHALPDTLDFERYHRFCS